MAERKTATKKTTTTTKKTTTRKRRAAAPTPEQIAERAYHLWLDGGSDPLANWLTAERQLAA